MPLSARSQPMSARLRETIALVSQQPPAEPVPASLTVGRLVRLEGRYTMHWENTHFATRLRRPWLGHRVVLCQLEPVEDIPQSPLEVLGEELPRDWRHHPAIALDIIVDAVPLERGSFGHGGMLTWRLEVQRWVSVQRRS
jgi:hypothetical protein